MIGLATSLVNKKIDFFSRPLDSLSDRMMYRMAFRMVGGNESIVLTHSVSTGGVAGARWYELRGSQSTGASFSLYQQGTFAPGDGVHRWMGSIAMDQAGDIALGYSASSGTRFPSVRYTGRVPTDALGSMGAETSIQEGSGSQTGYTRWGDYSSMRIDPSDDCTFWYVNEYLPVSSSYGWYTRIGAFKFSGCGTAPAADFSLSASPSSSTIVEGTSAVYTVTVTSLNGFSSPVDLTMLSCPSDTCSFNPASVKPPANGSANSTLTISNATQGFYGLTINGTGGVLHTASVSLTVTAVPSFTLGLSTDTLTVKRKSSGSLTVSLTGTGTATLSISGLPSKVTALFNPNTATATASSTLTISANPQAARGTYAVKVTGTSGAYTSDKTFTLIIN